MDSDSSSSSSSTHEQPLAAGRSLWDRLPMELRLMIVGFAGPLTCFLCGVTATTNSSNSNEANEAVEAIVAIWNDALALDWSGDLSLLPDVVLSARPRDGASAAMMLARSRSMYHRLVARFDGSNSKTSSSSSSSQDDRLHEILRMSNSYSLPTFVPESDNHLVHIAMRHCWIDLVDVRWPIAVGWQAIQYGHTALLAHLAFEQAVVHLNAFRKLAHFAAMDVAAIFAISAVLQLLHEAGSTHCSTGAMDYAALFGHVHVVQWLHVHRSEGCTRLAMDLAAKRGHLMVLRFLHANRTEGCTASALSLAIEHNRHDIVNWIQSTPGLVVHS